MRQVKRYFPLVLLIATIIASVAQRYLGPDSVVEEIAEHVIAAVMGDFNLGIDLTPDSPEKTHEVIINQVEKEKLRHPALNDEKTFNEVVSRVEDNILLTIEDNKVHGDRK